ncbi:MAG TPA: hypothetical protein VGC92_12805 [Phenylobacterium sp.]|jgi:hypothetical protein
MALKAVLAAVAAAAIGVGCLLPIGALGRAEPRSQIAQIEVHR